MTRSLRVWIDGQEVHAHQGEVILSAARRANIGIPSLCYHPRISGTGACRLCLVKIKGNSGLIPACTTPVSEGMEVTAFDEELEERRRTLLDLILSEHNCDCLACEAAGSCELQDLAYRYGLDSRTRSFPSSGSGLPLDNSSPVLVYDRSKCLVCSRCIKGCGEVQGKGVLGYAFRGPEIAVTAGLGALGSSECDGCGECVQLCPTGAIRERLPVRPARRWEAQLVRTVCSYCGVGCQIELWVKDGRITRVRGAEAPPNHGSLCVKGRFGHAYVESPDRLTAPLVRKNGVLRAASWDEALSFVAERLTAIKERHGPDALAGLASAKCTNEENYLFQKLMRAALGTNNVDHCARLCHAPSVAGLGMAFGSGAMTGSIAGLEHADCILVTGSNTTETHPVIASVIVRAVRVHGAKLIVVDPRRIDLVRYATLWLRPRGGTDVAWLNGLAHVILTEGLANKEFIQARTENFEAFREAAAGYTPDRVERITGIPSQDLIAAARLYGKSRAGIIVYAMGITQHVTGTDSVLALANLALLTGNVGRPGAGVYPLRGQNNVQGACDMGALPGVLPGYQRVTDPVVREKFREAWGVEVPPEPGLTMMEMLSAAAAGRVRALLIMGENLLLSAPHMGQVEETLRRLELLVVQDIFLTETAELAHVVLPAASFAEKDGTFTNTERRVLLLSKALEPPGEARPDWETLVALSNHLGYPLRYENTAQIMDEISSLTPIYGGIHHRRLVPNGLQWPCPTADHPGTEFLHEGGFARGRGRFHPVEYIPPSDLPDEEYPFLLSTGRILQHYHGGSMSRRVEPLNAFLNEGYLEIHPEDAERLGVLTGEMVRVKTRRGEVVVRAKLTERVAPGSAFLPFHFAEAAANRLTSNALDAVAKTPELKVAACRIERIEAAEEKEVRR